MIGYVTLGTKDLQKAAAFYDKIAAEMGIGRFMESDTFIAWGVDFKRGSVIRVPASNVDIAPTLLALKGINDAQGLEGRVLREALNGGPDEEQIPAQTRIYTTETADGKYQAVIEVTEVEHQRYIDKSWRVR